MNQDRGPLAALADKIEAVETPTPTMESVKDSHAHEYWRGYRAAKAEIVGIIREFAAVPEVPIPCPLPKPHPPHTWAYGYSQTLIECSGSPEPEPTPHPPMHHFDCAPGKCLHCPMAEPTEAASGDVAKYGRTE